MRFMNPSSSASRLAALQTPVQRTSRPAHSSGRPLRSLESSLPRSIVTKRSSTAPRRPSWIQGKCKSLPPAQLTLPHAFNDQASGRRVPCQHLSLTTQSRGYSGDRGSTGPARLHAICGQVHMLMVLHDDRADAMTAPCTALRARSSTACRYVPLGGRPYLCDGICAHFPA
jgi:hypothetical protein